MHLPLWEVDVPARSSVGHTSPRRVRCHVFIGQADSAETAYRAARDAYAQALLRHRTGQRIPREQEPYGWCAHGLRPEWDLDWSRATASRWVSSSNLGAAPYG
jgi:hypothetical protein